MNYYDNNDDDDDDDNNKEENFHDNSRTTSSDNFLHTSQSPNPFQYDENGNYIGDYEEDVFQSQRHQQQHQNEEEEEEEDNDRRRRRRSWTEDEDDDLEEEYGDEEEDGLEEECGDVVAPIIPTSRSDERKKFMDIMDTTSTSGKLSSAESHRSLGDRAEYDVDDHIYAGVVDDDDDDDDDDMNALSNTNVRKSKRQSIMKQSFQRGDGDHSSSSSKCCWREWNHPYIRQNRRRVICFLCFSIFLIGALIGTYVALKINNDKLRKENRKKKQAANDAAAEENNGSGNNATNAAEFDGDIYVPNQNNKKENIPTLQPSIHPTWSPTSYSTLWPTPSAA